VAIQAMLPDWVRMDIAHPSEKPKICFMAASEITVKAFLLEHLKTLSNFYAVSVAVNTQNKGFLDEYDLAVQICPINIRRSISPFLDFIALIRLIRLCRKERFRIIHSITPKAGLLSMVAGALTHVPIRIHIFTGQVWVTRKGFMRWFLKLADKVLSVCATHILADSQTQRQFLIDNKILPAEKIQVLANGSVCGVDTERFKPDRRARQEMRGRLGLSEADVVLLFMGRMNTDKGVLDLGRAFAQAFARENNVHLLFVGPDEDRLQDKIQNLCPVTDRMHFIPYTDIPEKWMAAADMLCLPSYREGFGNVIIEAAACGIPAIASRIYGITDAIAEGETGITHEVGNIDELANLVRELYSSPTKRKVMGENARARAKSMFSTEQVTKAWSEYYHSTQ
jgi:glycosyltransferase involved in cell wall biosynthesis